MSTIACKKSELVQSLLELGGHPYSLLGREPLVALYDLEETDKLLMMGRQFAKSTFEASDSLMDSAIRSFFKTLYVSPRQDQTSEFSNDKLKPFMTHSKKLRKMIIDGTCTDAVGKKTFTNGSVINLKYAFHTADAIRGVSADHVRVDEIQDILMSNMPVIEECLSGSNFQWRTYAGTPKTLNNTLAQKWFTSTQNEWILKCNGCNKWNIIGLENIAPEGLICKKCGKLFDRKMVKHNGFDLNLIENEAQWLAKFELKKQRNGIYMAGFRVPQVLSPMVKWERIIEKLNTYPTAKFMNEVLALPYDNSANPLTEEELKKICVVGKNEWVIPKDLAGMHLFMGVDWGHGDNSMSAKKGSPTGYTVATLGAYDWNGKFRLLAVKKFTGVESDPILQVQKVTEFARRLKVAGLGVDFGAGFMHNNQLKRNIGSDRIVEWQANDSLRVSAKWVPDAQRMLFNRTECMTQRFMEIKNEEVTFFNWDEFQETSADFLTIYIDYRSEGRNMFYNHTLPDDAFHAYMMCKMTADYVLGS